MTTLGERLQEAGLRLAARHVPDFPWTAALDPVLARAARNAAPLAGRFDRVERPPDRAERPPDRPAGPLRTHPAGRNALPGPRAPWPDEVPGGVPQAGSDGVTEARQVPLAQDVRGRLRDLAGPGADVLRPHVGAASDALARSLRADAVTLGADVHFRDGRFQPDEPEGFGLLAHEAAHVTQTRFPARQGASGGAPPHAHAGEDHALAVESAARWSFPAATRPDPAASEPPADWSTTAHPGAVSGIGVPGPPPARYGPPEAETGGPSTGTGATPAPPPIPLAAGTGRDVAAPPAPVDLERLRRDVVADLMRQVRAEFERGG
ncbi:eCIS core domain-containing protein [Actinomadura fibrosa]|uniref:DUF4157 domain-containing protein n=1 Tax=Actinomadura fibrosa TaxID=111802 RepID=A0ABW2XZ54_9ACTN|nr:DUF4157 domain-containing protein [Actinomadura fibrosa]